MIGWMYPALLGALAGVAIPVVMHFVKRRPRVVVVPTLQHVPRGFRAQRRRLRLHEWLLLALRIAVVAGFVMACAHPFVRSAMPAVAWQGDCTVFVLDASLSMQGRTARGAALWPQALAELTQRMAALPDGHDWRVFVYADDVVAALAPGDDWRARLAAWAHELPTYGGTDFNAVWRRVRAFMAEHGGRMRVVWLTDLQETALAAFEPQRLPAGTQVEIVPLQSAPDRASIAFADALIAARAGATAECVIIMTGDASPRAAEVYLDDVRIAAELAPAAERGANAYVARIPPCAPGMHVVRARLRADDAYAANNADSALLHVQEPWRIGLVSRSPAQDIARSKTMYLATALTTLVNESSWPVAPDTLTQEELATQRLENYRAIVLVDVATLAPGALERLQEYVTRGGSLLIFCGEHTSADGYNTQLLPAGLLPAQMLYPTARASDDEYTHITLRTWQPAHPALAWAEEPYAAQLANIHFARVMRTAPLPHSSVIMTFDNDAPALVAMTNGAGMVALFTSSADREWTSFPRSRLFVPFMRGVVRWLARQPGPDELIAVQPVRAGGPDTLARTPGIEIVSRAPFAAAKHLLPQDELAGAYGRPQAAQAALGVGDDAFLVTVHGARDGVRDVVLSWLIALVALLAAVEGIYANSVSYV